ncbi:MAG TPA: hypothetical protein VLF20_04525 [Patescibacteria group bacterium]|nr:hypothetical protein [Patescibacteria group bacterium]
MPKSEAPPKVERAKLPLRDKVRTQRRAATATTLAVASILALAGFEQRPTQTPFDISNPLVPASVVVLENASNGTPTRLNVQPWDNVNISETEDFIPINDKIKQITTLSDPYMENFGLLPLKIDNASAFSDWVRAQTQRADIRSYLNIAPQDEPTVEQLINLSAAIVIANVDYHEEYPIKPTGEIETNYDIPIDTILKRGIPIQCEGYAAATLAVFNELKDSYPEKLRNVYMVTEGGIQEGHEWLLVIHATGPNEATLSFIDPSADDPSYAEGESIKLGFVQILEGFHQKGIVDSPTVYDLAWQYYTQHQENMTTQELHEIVAEDYHYLASQPEMILNDNYARLAEVLLERNDVDELGELQNVRKHLYQYYINPANSNRPEDWLTKAQNLAEKMIAVGDELTTHDIARLRMTPETPEQYVEIYPHG